MVNKIVGTERDVILVVFVFVCRSNLGSAILQLKCLGIDNVLRFPFLSPPSSKAMVRGLELLYALGALNDHAKLAEPLGVRMAELPVSPMLAKMLLVSGWFLSRLRSKCETIGVTISGDGGGVNISG